MPRKGDRGRDVRRLQKLLVEKGYLARSGVDGIFGSNTHRAVRAFQSQNLDQHGQPLVIDGIAGLLTLWSLTHRKPFIETPSAVDYGSMPRRILGGSKKGKAALSAAIGELNAEAREIGGNNRGPFVRKYLNGIAPQGSPWCAGFVSWCFAQHGAGIPFNYSVGARDILRQFKRNEWDRKPGSGYKPVPGDVVVWWRVQAEGWHTMDYLGGR